MSQRRMPSGQRPARRTGSAGRAEPRSRAGRGSEAPRQTERRKPAAARRGSAAGGRPGGARPTAGARHTGNAKRTRAPQPRQLTGRATILLIVLISLALGYTYPIRVYLSQQSDIAEARASLDEQETRIAELREKAAKWQDDEYIRIQARKRLYYGRPGELLLIPWWDAEGAARDAGKEPPKPTAPPSPWYDTLWSSVQAANR
ncbi:FtsB family cell division protein [Rhizomonospora bruguierae]|uniref:FtsB family cell division protein n=1 Tax=Rhizomonospora bruguierae TaxID=1581705 RepID=UPI001BD0FE47|nr:septum formation initiator family protein [Micromonospora sp. NBRC 107566]